MPEDIMVTAVSGNNHNMNLLKKEEIDKESAKRQIPHLFRGYLMMGCEVGSGFFIDDKIKSVDVFTILDVKKYGRYALK